MEKCFEDEFMEIQSGLVSLCMEVTAGKVDKIYAYASIENKSMMFNAFFEKDGRAVTLNQLGVDRSLAMEFLKVGTSDLKKVKDLCAQFKVETPTELKMIYNVKTGEYKASYLYDEICSDISGLSSGEVFMEWYEEVKQGGHL